MAKVERIPGPGVGRLKIALKELDGARGKVGWFETAHYPDGTPVAYVAAVQEFGYPDGRIPPRLGMRATCDEQRATWANLSGRLSRQVLAGAMTALQAMEALGLKAAGDFRKHISQVTQPPLKPTTVKARLVGKRQGRVVSVTIAKPLVDSGELMGSVSNRVEATK